MSLLQNSNAIEAGSNYTISNSLRFRSSASAYLQRTPGSASNRTTWTWSAWVKRGSLGTRQRLFTAEVNSNTGDYLMFETTTDTLRYARSTSGIVNDELITSAVFRDTSAWYHIVFTFDSSQATDTNRIKLYVNGAQVTSFSTTNYPTLNLDSYVNSVNSHNIGRDTGGNYFDGYMTDINFIDGQALTPSSFGSTNATTGVWQPAKYTGTYGTNGFYLPFTTSQLNTLYTTTGPGFSTYAAKFEAPYFANYATGTTVGAGNYTFECWFNPKYIDPTNDVGLIGASSNGGFNIRLSAGGAGVRIDSYNISGTTFTIPTLSVGTWYHLAVVRSSGSATVFLNGTRSSSGAVSLATNYSGTTSRLATIGGGASDSFNGLISNLRLVVGTAVYSPASSTITVPTSALTAITNTKILTFQNSTFIDNSTNAYAITLTGLPVQDSSGNFNSWFGTNLSLTSGVTYDSMTDVPTLTSTTAANYATLNPLWKGNNSILNANLTYSGNGGVANSTFGMSSGKWYCEYTQGTTPAGQAQFVGIAIDSNNPNHSWLGQNSGEYSYANDAKKANAASQSAYGATWTSGDIIGIAFDADAGSITFYKNGVSQGTAFTGIASGNYYFACGNNPGSTVTGDFNFGQRPLSYSIPSGYSILNTYNLPDSTIKKGSSYMDATLWTGDGSAQTITNAGAFKPDLVWWKNRNSTRNNLVFDSIRGVGNYIQTNSTAAEATDAQMLTSFNSNGFTHGTATNGATNGETYVGWQWQAGQGSTSSNTNGSITSTVSVNANAGFSIVTYTGNSTSGATIGHGLGVAPKMIIVKTRNAVDNWAVYHSSIGATQYLQLNTTNASASSITLWNDTSPTSTVFSVGTNNDVNDSARTYVAYCFAEIAGFSKFGSYTGNGSADGPFVYTGFRPKFIIIKSSSVATTEWEMFDTSRNTGNLVNLQLMAHSNAAEATTTNAAIDLLSNGLKIRSTGTHVNSSSGTYIYMAFAENPFKNSLAR